MSVSLRLHNSVVSDDVLDLERVRADFPILSRRVHGKAFHYLDSGASSQKPRCVIDALSGLYEGYYANVHRGTYAFSERTTAAYESSRRACGLFLGAPSEDNIIFTSGATAAINLVAYSYGRHFLGAGDVVLVTVMEHHSNLVPWQMLRDECGIELRYVGVCDDGSLDMASFDSLLDERVKLVSCAHVSNVLGTVNPVAEIVAKSHSVGARVLLDGSQAVQHLAVDVAALDVDFYVFTGHKVYGPNGIGVLYGKSELLAEMPPFMGGGDMIRSVGLEHTTYADAPARFEAGTPPIAEAIALHAALDYVSGLGLSRIASHEHKVLSYAMERLSEVRGLRILGECSDKGPIVSFVLSGAHPHDLSTILDMQGVAVRAGHHCAEPLMERFAVSGTTRASFGVYSGADDVDALVMGLEKACNVLGLA